MVILAASAPAGAQLPGQAQTRPADGGPALPAGLAGPSENDPSQGPALPAGLDNDGGPVLPGGLDGGPALPGGLEEQPPAPTQPAEAEPEPLARRLGLTGFWEARGGVRTQPDRHEQDVSIGETRLQLDWQRRWEELTFQVTADLLWDPAYDHHHVNLQEGEGLLDLREANVAFSPAAFMDVKLGRHILTWGTGDLLFLNDLFPKDWVSFFVGRDVEYLKAPSDAVKVSVFSDLANVDVVYTPRFDPDRFIRGGRVSYYSSTLRRRAGQDAIVDPDLPDDCFRDSEWAVRLHRNVGSYELASYGYWGYWKSPGGVNPATGEATFPRLSVYGASVRGEALTGIANAEVAYYQSREDDDGENPFVNNSQMRFLLGWERDLPEIASDLRVGAQYYVEWMLNYNDYRQTLPAGTPAADEDRHVVTVRVTKQYLNQTLTLSLFAFYCPTDSDAYLRPRVGYDVTDNWTVEVGGNAFFGKYEHTFFNQFERNSNVYTAVRYSF
jgi:hypothetical protein